MTTLAERLRDTLRRDGAYHLEPDRITVHPVLNWGNFQMESFRVTDGLRTLHIKLAEPEQQIGLRRWMDLAEDLSTHYHAPSVLGWIDIPGVARGGLVFPHLPGATWKPTEQPQLAFPLAGTLTRLHADRELFARLPAEPLTFLQCWTARYREMWTEHIELLSNTPLPFVSPSTLNWMKHETERVLALPDGSPAFTPLTTSPCHWDLWGDNVLVGPHETFTILDWDDLAPGDPALDFATLLWPILSEQRTRWQTFLPNHADDLAFSARIDLHLRALTLDYTLDVVADWIECETSEWRDQVRPQKQAQHLEFLDLYRATWP